MTRILHLTDLHLRHHQPGTASNALRLSRDMPRLLDQLTSRLRPLAVDVVVISGDLLDVPDTVIAGGSDDGRDHNVWLAEVEADFCVIRDCLSNSGVDYVVCPGNHDHEPLFRAVFPGATEIVDVAGLRFFCFWDELGPDRQPRLTGPRRDLFDEALTLPEHDVPQIHVQHYMIDPPTMSKNWRYEYVGAGDFNSAWKRRVAFVLFCPGTTTRAFWFTTARSFIRLRRPSAKRRMPFASMIWPAMETFKLNITPSTVGIDGLSLGVPAAHNAKNYDSS